MQFIELKLVSDAGTPVAWPGMSSSVQVPLLTSVTPVWIGVSADGLTNQSYPISTATATILLTWPRLYQGISAVVLGDTNLYFNPISDVLRRIAACCLTVPSSDSSSAGSASASEPPPEPPEFQLQVFFEGSDSEAGRNPFFGFNAQPGTTSVFIDWGDGSEIEELATGGATSFFATKAFEANGFYNVRFAFVEPELITAAQFPDVQPDVLIHSVVFDAPFSAWNSLDLNSHLIEELHVDNLPALAELAMGGGTNMLTSQNVDELLTTLDANGVTDGIFDTTNQNPAAVPGVTGAAAKASLQGKGWTVNTD